MLISKQIKVILVFIFLLCFSASGYAWEATIQATGENCGGVATYSVIIGISSQDETLPSPPAPPDYCVKMDLNTTSWELVSKDIRQHSGSGQMWVIGIAPHGNIPSPSDRTVTISWDPSKFNYEGSYRLREGYDGTGQIVVSDMKSKSSYTITGSSGIQYFTVISKP